MNASPLERLRWAAAVASDPTLKDRGKVLAAVISNFLNAKSGEQCFNPMKLMFLYYNGRFCHEIIFSLYIG